MTSHRTLRRPGVTLMEVIIAIGVMAVGFLALLTLFPLGAFQIGQALKDDRCAQLAQQADTTVRLHWQLHVVPQQGGPSYVWAMDDPNLMLKSPSGPGQVGLHYNTFVLPTGATIPSAAPMPPPDPPPPTPISVTSLIQEIHTYPTAAPPGAISPMYTPIMGVDRGRPGGPSYPVFLDPIGWHGRSALGEQHWVGQSTYLTAPATPLLIPRRKFTPFPSGDPFSNNSFQAFRLCGLLDDMSFESNGAPVDPNQISTDNLRRQGRYTWSAMVRRRDNSKLIEADLTILVFDGRSPFSVPPKDEVVVNPLPITGPITGPQIFVGQPSITLDIPDRTSEQAKLVRKGGFLLDGTISLGDGIRSADFYRIIGVTEGASPKGAGFTRYTLDLDKPFQGRIPTQLVSGTQTPSQELMQFYFFAGLAEVFVRDPLKPLPTP